MNGHGKDELVVVLVEVIEVVHPDGLDISRVNPAMRICGLLDKHHRW